MSDIDAITVQEIEIITRFIGLLREEQTCLQNADPEPLVEVTTKKPLLVEQLNQLEVERRVALSIDSDTDSRTGMAAWLAANNKYVGTAANWEKLLNLAREAKTLHEINTRLVDLHLKHTSDALAVLTRQPIPKTLYGSNGQAAPLSGSRIVDSA